MVIVMILVTSWWDTASNRKVWGIQHKRSSQLHELTAGGGLKTLRIQCRGKGGEENVNADMMAVSVQLHSFPPYCVLCCDQSGWPNE